MALLVRGTRRSPKRDRPPRRPAGILRHVVIWSVGLSSLARAAISDEYQLKAVFLYNFAQFVEWPSTAFSDQTESFSIGILGTDPFGPVMDEVVRNEKVGQRALVVQRFHSVDEIKTCHLLFVSRSEAARHAAIFAALENRHILTVSDNPEFEVAGGMIRFVTERHKIRLRINVRAAEAAGLKISSQLLRSATIVTPRGKG